MTNELRYDESLVAYIFQLEFQAAMLLLYANNSLVHATPEYRKPADGEEGVDALYKSSETLLMTCCAASVALHARLITAQCLPRATLEELELPPMNASDSQALRKWFVERAGRCITRLASDWLRDRYVESCLWPAEREFYKIENPKDSTATTISVLKRYRDPSTADTGDGDRSIIKARRGVQYAGIIEDAQRSQAEIIERELSAEPCAVESRLLQLALVEMTSMDAIKHWKMTDWFEYCTLARDLDTQYESFSYDQERPRIVQIFHHFQLVWKRRVVWLNSYVEALVYWYEIMSRKRGDLPPFHLSQRISIEDTAREIFGDSPCGKRWWPKRMEAEDDDLPRAPPSLYRF